MCEEDPAGDTGQRFVHIFFQAEIVEVGHLAIERKQLPGFLKRRDTLNPCRGSGRLAWGSLSEGFALES